MENIITEQYHSMKIKNGWVDFLLNAKVECAHCHNEFGPMDDEIICISGKNVLGWICGSLIHIVGRIDEVLRLTWEDIDFKKRTVTKWTRKRKSGSYESITLHMNDDLQMILKKRWNSRENDEWVFYNDKTGTRYFHRPKLMKGLCKRAGIKPAFGFHNIRHFVASYLADFEKISKKTIGGLLGHKSLQTTEIYLHSIDGLEREAINRLTGKFS